jgi:hypothetical protein
MKKVIFTLSILTALSASVFGQACGTTSSCTPRAATGIAGLTPVSDSLPCFEKGWTGTQYIYFENYTSFQDATLGSVTINSLKIDSIANLPAGLCWKTNKANNTWNGGQTGCIEVSGTVLGSNPAGQYKLRIIATVATNIITLPGINVEERAGLRYYVRVNCGSTCPAVDTVAGETQSFVAFAGQNCNSVEEVSENITSLSVLPNPFSSSATVSFVADRQEKYTARLSNILGNVVYNTEVVSTIGENTMKLNRNGYAPGVYFFSITNGKSSMTKRVVIE